MVHRLLDQRCRTRGFLRLPGAKRRLAATANVEPLHKSRVQPREDAD